MKKNGFTLIELLAVIIILAVIALITTPIVLNIVDEARDKANLATANGYLEAARLYYAESKLNSEKKKDVDYVNNIYDKITVKGKKPDNGELYVNSNGKIALAVILDDECYKKEFDGEIQILEEYETCEINSTEDETVKVVWTKYSADATLVSSKYKQIEVATTQTFTESTYNSTKVQYPGWTFDETTGFSGSSEDLHMFYSYYVTPTEVWYTGPPLCADDPNTSTPELGCSIGYYLFTLTQKAEHITEYSYSQGGTSYGTISVETGVLPETGTLIEGSATDNYCVIEANGTNYYYVRN